MLFQNGRSIARLSHLKAQCLHPRQSLVSSNIERVAGAIALLSRYNALNGSLCASVTARTYAGRPASRPKQHTGRTTSTRKPKAPPKKPAAGSAVKTKKAKPKKAKAKPARKTKAKPKPRKRKVLTEAQKASKEKTASNNKIKTYKEQALTPPTRHSRTSAWVIFSSEYAKSKKGASFPGFTNLTKEAAARWKSIRPEELEHYNQLANQAKERGARDYRQFIASKSPAEIKQANLARRALSRISKKDKSVRVAATYKTPLKDERQVKSFRTAFNYFTTERNHSNDYKGMDLPTRSRLLGREWKELSASDKKPYEDNAAADAERYRQELKTVLGREPKHRKKTTS